MEQDTMLQRYPTAGIPLAYAVVGGYAHLAPVPDAAYTLKSQFYLRQAVLTTAYGVGDGPTFENNWMLHASAWLMAELGEVLAKYYVRDTEAAALFHGDAQLARSTCYTDTVARQEANALRSMGDD